MTIKNIIDIIHNIIMILSFNLFKEKYVKDQIFRLNFNLKNSLKYY